LIGSAFLSIVRTNAHVAQSVEHFLGKEEVTGSNPVVGFPELRVGIDLLKKFFEADYNERPDFAFVRDLQVAQLHDQQEQEDADRQVCDQEILFEVPRPHRTQRRQNYLMSRDAGKIF
jgi:hypothetical protein